MSGQTITMEANVYPPKRGWMRVTDGRPFQLYVEVMNHTKELGLWPETKEIPRLYTRTSVETFGCCFTRKCADGSYVFAIVVNKILVNYSDDQIRKILVHEVAHALHTEENHGSAWRRDANRIGEKWGYIADVYTLDRELIKGIEESNKQA